VHQQSCGRSATVICLTTSPPCEKPSPHSERVANRRRSSLPGRYQLFAVCKVIAHNLCVLIACTHEIGLDVPQFQAN